MHFYSHANASNIRSAAMLGMPVLIGIALGVAVNFSVVDTSLAAAIVGETRSVALVQPAPSRIMGLKNQYQRPSEIPFPENNGYTLTKALLGERLFFDRRLSGSTAQSCGSCHDPGFAWGDGLPVAIGNGMVKLSRRSPSIVNVAWGAAYTWDGRAVSLEQHALGSIAGSIPLDRVLLRLNAIAEYRALFNAAFPGEGLTENSLAKALATYERTIVSGRAPFDAWIAGDEQAISDAAKRGFIIFNTRGHCASCHEGWNFTNDGFQDIGLPGFDVGRAKYLPQIQKMDHAFKTPGLREVAYRGPYMHDGSIATLDAVVEHYNRGGIDRPSRSDLIVPLGLTEQDKLDLVAFLKSLSSKLAPTTIPVFPN